jgi:hypothetical protein
MATDSGFPKPYIDSVKESGEDAFIQRVPLKHLDIGARPSGMPGSVKPEKMGIEHVGGSATGRK